jgi:hypothetical protein
LHRLLVGKTIYQKKMTTPNTPFTMKTTWIKTALLVALMATGGAIEQAAHSSAPFNEPVTKIETSDVPVDADQQEKEFYKWIRKNIGLPDFIQDQNDHHRLELAISVDENGKILVKELEGQNRELIDYVDSKLKSLHCPIQFAGSSFHFAMRFYRINS